MSYDKVVDSAALDASFAAIANAIRGKTGKTAQIAVGNMPTEIESIETTPLTQTKTVTAGTSATTVSPDSGYLLSSVTVNPTPSEAKTATPSTSSQTITPSTGKLLSQVTVSAISTETKTVTPTTSSQTVKPSSGKYFSQVTVNAISTETKTVTPTASTQTVSPSSGKYLSKVTVNGDSDLKAENIRSGVDIFGVVGTMTAGVSGIDYGVITLNATTTVTITHNLKTVPTFFALIAAEMLVHDNNQVTGLMARTQPNTLDIVALKGDVQATQYVVGATGNASVFPNDAAASQGMAECISWNQNTVTINLPARYNGKYFWFVVTE